MYLYRITTKQSSVWNKTKPKPIYFVAAGKEECKEWANRNLTEGLMVSKIAQIAVQVAGSIFVGQPSKRI